eukprot:g43137.t1
MVTVISAACLNASDPAEEDQPLPPSNSPCPKRHRGRKPSSRRYLPMVLRGGKFEGAFHVEPIVCVSGGSLLKLLQCFAAAGCGVGALEVLVKGAGSERGALWSDAETLALIAVWSEENVQTALDEQLRNSHVFKFISSQLLDQGYIRTPEQCRIRIKGLKRKYTLAKDSIKRGCSASGRKICRFYEQLDVVLGSRIANERPVFIDAIATTGESLDIKEEQNSPRSDISQRVECRNGHCSSEEPDHSLGETSNRPFEPQPSTSAFCTTDEVPEDWRLANVMLLFKKGGKEKLGNYRP